MNKKIIVMGGGTVHHMRSHLALCAPAYGTTAKKIAELSEKRFPNMDVELVLTKMADSSSSLETNEDVEKYIDEMITDNTVKILFFNVALCDFEGEVAHKYPGKYQDRMDTSAGPTYAKLTPAKKIIAKIRENRKDIFLVGFKTTCNEDVMDMYRKGMGLLKQSSCNLVMANDVGTRINFICTPEEGIYGYGKEGTADLTREECLEEIVDIAWHRTHLSFTRSNVVDGKRVSWGEVSDMFPSLTTVVNYCITQNAYKLNGGSTAGHFAAKMDSNEFLTSIRKSNFNEINEVGMVRVVTDGEDNVIAYGAKPSVGGQSQRKIFAKYGDANCIVHFHCPLKGDHVDNIPVVSQREYECGSHECGENTANGLEKFGNLYCVMLDNHGPNIVFHHSVDPQEIITFIDNNFDMSATTAGFEKVKLDI